MNVKIEKWSPRSTSAAVAAFLSRPAFDPAAEQAAAGILDDIRRHGDEAVCRYVARFDGAALKPAQLRVSARELRDADASVPARQRRAVAESLRRVKAFARAGMKRDWTMPSPGGGVLGEQFSPLSRVGVYVPGGAAPLASTAIMTVPLAVVAGVPEIVACTPAGPDGRVNPVLLHALKVAGATEIYKVGGIQAIGMMAYGTRSVPRVLKIVGPGGPYVTAAKRLVYGQVALDLVAGPSEIAVLADDTADAGHVAVDLLSQAEHGTGWEKALLVTTSATLAAAVSRRLAAEAATLTTRGAVEKVMARGGILIVVVGSVADGMELCNRFAPEHFEIMVRRARAWSRKARTAGAVFVGRWTPESAGDFAAGPSHVLPTGGAAAMFSGLTVDDFRRRSSLVALTRRDLKEMLPVIEVFGEVEGLDAHARSARIRF